MKTALVNSIYKTSKKQDSNIFLQSKNNLTSSGNGAAKLKSTGNIFLDDFASISKYKSRELSEVLDTITPEFEKDPLLATKLAFYIRTITRQPKVLDKKYSTQRGAGWRNEFLCRMLYLAENHPETFLNNMHLIPLAGSWKDIFDLLRYDLYYNGKPEIFDWDKVFARMLTIPDTGLMLKYAPSVKSSKKCTTLKQQANNYIAKWLANKLFSQGNVSKKDKYRNYNKFKATNAATDWQKCISEQNYDLLDFNTIPGRALNTLANSKFFSNHGLEEKFLEFVKNQPTLKFTGFPYELFKLNNRVNAYQKIIVDKQFKQLIKSSNIDAQSNLITCVDSSGSMQCAACGTTISALSVAMSMAAFFSYTLKGKFANTFLEFNRETVIREFKSDSPYDRVLNTPLSHYCFNTDFLSVADCICGLKGQGYPEEDFPTGVLCISDGEFDRGKDSYTTNFAEFKQKLTNAGFSKKFVDDFKLILWDVPNNFYGKPVSKFEGLANTPNFFYMSGFDPAAIQFLFGGNEHKSTPKTAEELFNAAMDQELLNEIAMFD